MPSDGTYTILATDWAFDGDDTGDYHLHLQRLNEPGNATALPFGQTSSFALLPIDEVAPHVDSFTINDGAPITTIPDVMLDTAVSDPAPSSGVDAVFYIEYEYSQSADVWVPAQWSGWLDYKSSQVNYPWELLPSAGAKYMQAWAADGAGNISLFPYSDFINYHPPADSLSLGQSRVYRYTLAADQTLTVHIDPISSDTLFVPTTTR